MQESPVHQMSRARGPSHVVRDLALAAAVWSTMWLKQAVAKHILPPRLVAGQRGSGTVETIGWIGIAIAVVVAVGAIVRLKLTNLANSLPDTLNW